MLFSPQKITDSNNTDQETLLLPGESLSRGGYCRALRAFDYSTTDNASVSCCSIFFIFRSMYL